MPVIAQLIGIAFIVPGVVTIYRRRARASPEGEDEREYRGVSAVLLGILWIVPGGIIVRYPNLLF